MTWSVRAVVQSVSNEDNPDVFEVVATATAGETYTTQRVVRYEGNNEPVYEDVELARITSNTEGKLVGVELHFHVEAETVSLKAGDEIYASGHFDVRLPA